MNAMVMPDVIWSLTPFSLDEMSPYITWSTIKRKRYFYIREDEKDNSLKLRVATLRSCGQKTSLDLNNKYFMHPAFITTLQPRMYAVRKNWDPDIKIFSARILIDVRVRTSLRKKQFTKMISLAS